MNEPPRMKPSTLIAALLGGALVKWYQNLPQDRRQRAQMILGAVMSVFFMFGAGISLLWLMRGEKAWLIGEAIVFAVLSAYLYTKTIAKNKLTRILGGICAGLALTICLLGIIAFLSYITQVRIIPL